MGNFLCRFVTRSVCKCTCLSQRQISVVFYVGLSVSPTILSQRQFWSLGLSVIQSVSKNRRAAILTRDTPRRWGHNRICWFWSSGSGQSWGAPRRERRLSQWQRPERRVVGGSNPSAPPQPSLSALCSSGQLVCVDITQGKLDFNIQAHKRFKRTLFIRTIHNVRIFGVIPFTTNRQLATNPRLATDLATNRHLHNSSKSSQSCFRFV